MSSFQDETHSLAEVFNLWILECKILELIVDVLCFAPSDLELVDGDRLCFQSRQHAFFFAWHQKDEAFALAFISCGSADPVNIGFRVFRSVDLQDPIH